SPGEAQTVSLVMEPGDPDMDMYLNATYDVVFDEAPPVMKQSVIDSLTSIREYIHGRVFPALNALFPRS
ncbi:MAG TPA: hypothetical protein VJ922_04305, partial [Actinomycetota bacterium]|nr:hypothetical protein [Actinomycetota bacterium]